MDSRRAIVAPGRGYGPDGPLLMYASVAVHRRGGVVDPLQWPQDADFASAASWVPAQVDGVLDDDSLVIGKSLGTLAAPVVADRSLPAIWFTPLLTHDATVDAMRRATGPCLLVGGTADKLWDGPVARSITEHVVEIEDADHGMFVPGDLAASAAVLGEIATAVENFLDTVVWR